MIYGLWFMVCGLGFMDEWLGFRVEAVSGWRVPIYDVECVVCGLWFMF